MTRSFKLLRTLGTGAFGSVHLAEVQGDEDYVQRLAVKWLHPHLKEDADLAQRLRDEARLLALLDHDNIVRVHGLTHIDGRLAVLMEPVQGADLARAEGSSVPPRAAVEAVEAVADALRAAWETAPPGQRQPLRVVHRDIKPSNIMVTPRGGVKVMDFGVARATFETREARTRSQQFGTARYMAPERWLDGVAEAASDVFSLGVTLVELVTGTPMERPRLAKDAYAEDLERSLEGLAPWPTLRDLARVMCAHDPTARPTAAEVVQRCHPLAEEVPGPGLREWAMDWVP
ncbi:MAG: serine/threonine protein kinase, partial [Deltaproteobacteria bacterium]|nr:serine/threonine protein kinase [Deltaproteobacteria bacterium]